MKIKKAIILGAGFGKRMYPITKKIPKPLVKIKNKTMLENSISFLISLGVKHIIINTHYLHNQISSFVKNKKFSCKIDLVFEKKKMGESIPIASCSGDNLSFQDHSNWANPARRYGQFVWLTLSQSWRINYCRRAYE